MRRWAPSFRPWPSGCRTLAVVLVLSTLCGRADDADTAWRLLRTGKFGQCIEACEKPRPDDHQHEEWGLIHAQALLCVGRYPEAEAVVSNALARSQNSIRLRLLGAETANHSGNAKLAQPRLKEINDLAASRLWAYRDPPNVVALGRAALLMGADPKTVLERLFSVAQRADPELRGAWLATGRLALDKHDFALAAKTLSEASKKFPDDADVQYGLAEAYQPNARGRMLELLESALEKNENHVPSMLLLADHLVDAEEYQEADKMVTRALEVNPWHPEAWAYRAVLAHLRNDPVGEARARENAFKYWDTNPRVDHLIGAKLSQNYRFAEGATCQRRALAFDPAFLPARIQLAEDLLRLGDEAEGWKLVEEVHRHDGYDVTAYNLVTLRGTMQKFQTLSNADFVLRMSAHEAALYGDRALELLGQAKARLAEKYGLTLQSPTFVEMFAEQKDFAVRTFGMPGNPGFLGVCFGRVVTANSPASQSGNPANWEAVLWHEFCHVVTLKLTKNKMPRWLSEGISVYEELQANPSWGQTMNPRYREMILGDDLKPVSELSAAFMSPKTDLHLQFAYYQSALVVEFLVDKFGSDKLKAILRDLGSGVQINDAIPKHTAPMKQVEKEFAAFAKAKAEALGPGLDWEKPKGERRGLNVLKLPDIEKDIAAAAAKAHSPVESPANNYWRLMEQAGKLVREKKWAEAKGPLEKLVQLYPNQSGPDNAYALLAAAHRGLNDTKAERAALDKWASLDADVPDAYLRLMELAEDAKDWPAVSLNAERFLAVNPLLPQPYHFLGRAGEELGDASRAIFAYQKLLLLDPPDPADVHFRLARLLRKQDEAPAKRHVLQALEEAPRFREAHRLLLELAQASPAPTNSPAIPLP